MWNIGQIKLKTSLIKTSLRDYSDAYTLVSGTIIIIGASNNATDADKRTKIINKKVIFKNCAPLTDCVSKINRTQIDYTKDLNIVMPKHNLIESSDKYLKSTWKFMAFSDEPVLNDDASINICLAMILRVNPN